MNFSVMAKFLSAEKSNSAVRRAAQNIPRHRSLNPGGGHDIRSRIKPMGRAALGELPIDAAGSKVRPLWNIRAASARAGSAGNRKGKSGTQLDDGLNLPAPGNHSCATLPLFRKALSCAEGKFVTRTAHRTAAGVVIRVGAIKRKVG